MHVKLCMIPISMTRYEVIWHYECMYEVGCLILYLALDKAKGIYFLHCTSIAWVIYTLGWYLVGLSYDAYFM